LSDAATIPPSKLPSAHAKRLSWALNAYGHLLAVAVRQDTSPEAREVGNLPDEQVPEHVARLIQDKADPTVAKTMTGWLVKQYVQGALRLEDLGTAYETLDMFHRYAQRLPKGEQDLGQYQSLAKVWEAVSPIAEGEQDRLSGKAQKALERDKAYAESRILRQDEDGFTIAVPLTEFAAKWWGRGTRWCTAAEKNNRFWKYHEDSPLIVVVIPELKEKGKFQFWVTEHSFQFMDATDNPISEVLITNYWPHFEPIISFALLLNGQALEHVPKKLRTKELCKIAVTQNHRALQHMPLAQRTEEVSRFAVAQDGRALGYVPEDLRTEEMCRIAVAQNGLALRYVPQHLRTEELCRIATAQDGGSLECVPDNLRTKKLCRIAVAQVGGALEYVPEDLRTEELCRIAVAQYGTALQHVPENLRTEEMCRIAVAQNGWALGEVPGKLRMEEMCRIAVADNGEALFSVPEKLRTEEMCSTAVAQDGWALRYVPETLRTDEMCSIAVAQDGGALQYLPWEMRTEELCRIAVAQNGAALQYVPEDLRTADLCKIAVTQNGYALWAVPEKLHTEDMCRIAVAQNWEALIHVPEALCDQMRVLIPVPHPDWDLLLLDDLAVALDRPTSPGLSGPAHA
jgi:hypothetical protein